MSKLRQKRKFGSAVSFGKHCAIDGEARRAVRRPRRQRRSDPAETLGTRNQTSEDLRVFCEAGCAKQMDRSALSAFRLDIVAGEFRPVAHNLVDALST